LTHRCDYCGTTFDLLSDDDMILCECCGEARLYNVKESRVSYHYSFVGSDGPPVILEEGEEEPVKKKEKKKSKDIRAKKTPLTYAEQIRQRYNYKNS